MDQGEWNAFNSYLWDLIGTRCYDDTAPAEVVTWLLQTWPFDKARSSRDELLRFFPVTDIQSKLPTWWQIHEGLITGKNPYDCERKVTPRPPGAGIFRVGSMEDLRADVVRNGLKVIDGSAT
jgi:hypothetical protein